jgi:hypothetical protein
VSDLLRLLVDLFNAVWPFRVVNQWQKGAYYVCGRYCGWVGPGCYPFVPFFSDVVVVLAKPAIWPIPLLNVSLRDGRVLAYSAMVTLQIEDMNLAMNEVAEWTESCVERVSGVLSQGLADAKPERFDPARGKRDNLIEELREAADRETREWGVRVISISFPNFVLNVRTHRVLMDRATFSESQIGV